MEKINEKVKGVSVKVSVDTTEIDEAIDKVKALGQETKKVNRVLLAFKIVGLVFQLGLFGAAVFLCIFLFQFIK